MAFSLRRRRPYTAKSLVRNFSDEDVRRKPASGEWAVIEVIAHMADTDERAFGRVKKIVAEYDPDLPGFDQDQLAIDRGRMVV